MVEIELDINKSVEQNAEFYYNRAKKAKAKIQGIQKILQEQKIALSRLEKDKDKILKQIEVEDIRDSEKQKLKERKKEWYEKFRWFFTSDKHLVVGGRDATTNDIIVKKHMDKNDLVFHTESPGSPFFVVKDGKNISKEMKEEVAIATACYSKAWKLSIAATEVFCVFAEQVSQTPMSGEYLGKGAFMIYGKKEFFHPELKLAVGITKEGAIMGGSEASIKANCEKYVNIVLGNEKPSDIAKKVQFKLGGDLDEILRTLPSGGCNLKK